MSSISIAQRLWFDQTFLGATLNFQAGEGPNAVLFRVGLSTQSLGACQKQLNRSSCAWTIRDQTLTITGDGEELCLTFCVTDGSGLQASISLYGEELETFKIVVQGFACAGQFVLN